MAQREVDRIWEDLRRVQQEFQAADEKLLKAVENELNPLLIDIFREDKARLAKKEDDLRKELSRMRELLASPSGEVPCCQLRLHQRFYLTTAQ